MLVLAASLSTVISKGYWRGWQRRSQLEKQQLLSKVGPELVASSTLIDISLCSACSEVVEVAEGSIGCSSLSDPELDSLADACSSMMRGRFDMPWDLV